MKRKMLLASVFSIALIASSQTGTLHRDGSKELAVAFARTLNTAALTYKVRHNSYPTWDQLVSTLKDGKPVSSVIDFNSPAPLSGFSVRWSLGPDGARYDFLVTEKKKCGANVLSNEAGVIYLATALGCD